MDKAIAIPMTVLAGGLIALQAPVNGMLGRTVGIFTAASVSFILGTVALVAVNLLVGGGFGRVAEAGNLSWYYLTGGILGAAYVTTALTTVRALGAGAVTAATIAGQLSCSILIDRLGILGLEPRPLSPLRLLGVALLAAGTFLVVRE